MNDVIDAGAAFRQRLDSVATDIETLLGRLLDDTLLREELARPKRLMDAMRHVALGGGKRLRPFLVVETAALFNAPRSRALMAGAALECVRKSGNASQAARQELYTRLVAGSQSRSDVFGKYEREKSGQRLSVSP